MKPDISDGMSTRMLRKLFAREPLAPGITVVVWVVEVAVVIGLLLLSYSFLNARVLAYYQAMDLTFVARDHREQALELEQACASGPPGECQQRHSEIADSLRNLSAEELARAEAMREEMPGWPAVLMPLVVALVSARFVIWRTVV